MKKTILLYDDDQEILTLCKIILSKYGYRTETRLTCDNILEDVDLIEPDLIVIDLWIPEMGGEKAIMSLKRHEDKRRIPVVIFSANADIRIICEKINADGYIEKPFSVKTFVSTIQKHL